MPLRSSPREQDQFIDLRIADVDVRVTAPIELVEVLNATLTHVPRHQDSPKLTVSVVRSDDDSWAIRSASRAQSILGPESAPPRVAGATVSTLLSDVATLRKYVILRAVVVSRGAKAVALVGTDWEPSLSIAGHLHVRGWKYLASDNVLVDPNSLEVIPFQKSLYVNSTSLSHVPEAYRGAVERSPWYVTSKGISFYAVDPTRVGRGETWASVATLRGILSVQSVTERRTVLENLRNETHGLGDYVPRDLALSQLATARLKLGSYIDACDLIEAWLAEI